MESEGFLKPKTCQVFLGAPIPAPEDGELVLTKALVERGFSLPPSDFFLEILTKYGLQPHNISPNIILAISNHVALCAGHLRIEPDLTLFQYYFSVKKEYVPNTNTLANCGIVTFKIGPNRIYPRMECHESVRYWSTEFFYAKDTNAPNRPSGLPPFKDGATTEIATWNANPNIADYPNIEKMGRRISKLVAARLIGKDLALSWFTKWIQPI
jgi:hypothetical protein